MPKKSKSSRARGVTGGQDEIALVTTSALTIPRSTPPSFVLLSDLHAHVWSAFSKGDGSDNSRLKRSLLILDQSLAKARELGVPWVFAGDIVHTAGYALNVVLGGLTDVLLRYPDVPKLVTWGNHDARGVGGKITFEQTVLATLSKVVPQFYVLDPSIAIAPVTLGGLTFSGAGYQPRSDLLEYAAPSDVGIYHQTVRGTKAPNGFVLEEGIPAEELLKRHRVSVVGHVHHWQYHPACCPGQQMILIPGSPEHQNFGDMNEHGWWVISLGAEKVEAEFTPGGSPEFRTVSSPSGVKNDGHFYRVSGGMNGVPLPDGAIAIAPVPTTVQSRDVLHGARGDQALGAWFREKPPEAIELGEERFLATGRALLGLHEMGNLRPLQLQQIRIRNFCSYSDQEFNVRPGTWLVVGRGRDFPSNGAGKSTLFEAVFWALFGRTTKGLTGDEVIRWGTKDCEVELEFSMDEPREWLHVRRTRGASSRLEIESGTSDRRLGRTMEAKSVNEMTEKLSQYLGITPELYQALGYFSQEKLLLFASATDGERKDMLADLIGLSAYQEASQEAHGKIMELDVVAHKIVAFKEVAEARVTSETRRLNETAERSHQWEEDRTNRQLAGCQAEAEFEQSIPMTRERLLGETRLRLGSTLKQREEEVLAHLGPAQEALQAFCAETNTPQELLAAQQEHSRVLSDVKSTRALIAENDRQCMSVQQRLGVQRAALATGKCPTCEQEVTPDHKEKCLAPVRSELAGLGERKKELEQELAPRLQLVLGWQARVGTVAAGVAAGEKRAQWVAILTEAEKTLDDIERERVGVEASATWHADKIISDRRKELTTAVAAIRRERNPYDMETDATQQRIREAAVDVMHHTEERIRVQEEVAIYDYWRHGFSKQGIQSLLVDEVAGLFNATRGTIFPALTQGVYDVQFSTLSQTKQGEWREKSEFQIYERGQPVPYAALSGGQRRRVDVGVMLTLVKAVSKWMQVPGMLGVLVLDEVFGFLDGSGAEGLMEALREMQEQIPSIFVVSHEPQLQALFPEIIVVEQGQDGVSRILTESAA